MHLEELEVDNAAAWSRWLQKNHLGSRGVWLVFRKEGTGPTMTYDEALEEALAYGWIDSILKKLDDSRHARKFTPRRPWSIWSRRNIERVEALKREGRMTKWGLNAFDKRTLEVSQLEKVNSEGVVVPQDLTEALRRNKKALANFEKFAPGYRKKYLVWISAAKKPETRRKRISEAVELISENVKDLLK
jgi:uncharacterized protein YdeI (YjbR/CyaY-like superfamily)